jgi:hypothetical protein
VSPPPPAARRGSPASAELISPAAPSDAASGQLAATLGFEDAAWDSEGTAQAEEGAESDAESVLGSLDEWL